MDHHYFNSLRSKYDALQASKAQVRLDVRDKYAPIIEEEIESLILMKEVEFAQELVKARRSGVKRQDLTRVIRTRTNSVWQRFMELGGWDKDPTVAKKIGDEFFELLDDSVPARFLLRGVPGTEIKFAGRVEVHAVAEEDIALKYWVVGADVSDFEFEGDTHVFARNEREIRIGFRDFVKSGGVALDWDKHFEYQESKK